MKKPSSTITAASLAAAGVTLAWALVDNFTALEVSASVVSGSTGFVAALFGYFKKENVLPLKQPGEIAQRPAK